MGGLFIGSFRHYLERNHSVHIVYDKRFMTDECYPLSLMTRLNVKGKAENIRGVHQDINKFIKSLQVR